MAMDEAQLRRHLSAPRSLVLDILAEEGDADEAYILHAWMNRRPAMTPAHLQRLPRMVGELLWRLKNLEWITEDAGRHSLTELGQRARAQGRVPRDSPALRGSA